MSYKSDNLKCHYNNLKAKQKAKIQARIKGLNKAKKLKVTSRIKSVEKAKSELRKSLKLKANLMSSFSELENYFRNKFDNMNITIQNNIYR